MADLSSWIGSQVTEVDPDGSITATFIVDTDGVLCLATRRSEHVACASGRPVLSAGEITFLFDGEVTQISNQSTGYCAEPESWPQVAAALDGIGVPHPNTFTTPIVFRLCPNCKERNIVKNDWFVCDLCGADLPKTWNFADD